MVQLQPCANCAGVTTGACSLIVQTELTGTEETVCVKLFALDSVSSALGPGLGHVTCTRNGEVGSGPAVLFTTVFTTVIVPVGGMHDQVLRTVCFKAVAGFVMVAA